MGVAGVGWEWAGPREGAGQVEASEGVTHAKRGMGKLQPQDHMRPVKLFNLACPT